ncbi:MAG: GFA family protein [Steroidobacteraceae bacterium]
MIEGGCLCGAVRYRLGEAPSSSVNCHCRSCRRASGAPVVAWITVRRPQFTILSGVPAVFHSSPGVTRRFCSHCGTGLTYESERHPHTIDVTSASLDDPEAYPPTADVLLEDKLSWQATSPHTEKFAGFSSG